MTDLLAQHRRGLRSVNEPNSGRKVMLTPMSINEPLRLPDPPDAVAPTLSSLSPAQAAIGDADLVMQCIGSGFALDAVITFNGGDEPTTFVSSTEVTTVVKPSTASVPGTYPVTVRNGELESAPQGFTFTEAGAPAADDPDDLETEIEEAVAEGDVTMRKSPRRKR